MKHCEIGSYDHQIAVPVPKHMIQYRSNRVKAGLSNKIGIDKCILPEIQELWSKGIITYGSCCGHGEQESMVNVDKKNIQQMIDMGYEMNHPDKSRRDTLKLKTLTHERHILHPQQYSRNSYGEETGSSR